MLLHTNMASEQKMLVCIRKGLASLLNINGRASCRWIFIYLTRSLQVSYCTPLTPYVLPRLGCFSYIGHQKGFWSTGGSGSLLQGFPQSSPSDPQYPSGPADSPANTSSSSPMGIFLAEKWTWSSLPREVSSFSSCVAVPFHIWWLLPRPRAVVFLWQPAAICPLPLGYVAPALLWFPFSRCLQHALSSAPASLCAGG